MKILHTCESYDPELNGMQTVVKRISERLVRKGHDVTVATRFQNRDWKELNGVKVEEFKIQTIWPQRIDATKDEIERYKDFVKNGDWDVVTFFAAQIWHVDLLLDELDEIKAKKVFVPTGFSGLPLPEYKEYFEKMKVWLKEFDMNVFISKDYRDINFAKENGVKKYTIIPNAANEEEFKEKSSIDIRKKVGIDKDDFLVFTIGQHTHMKGHKEAIKMFSKADVKNSTLWILGNDDGQRIWRQPFKQFVKSIIKFMLLRDGLTCIESCTLRSWLFNLSPKRLFDHNRILVKYVPREEAVAAFQNSDIFLYPSNLECSPTVLYEAFASGLPALVSDAGNMVEMIDVSKGGYVIQTVKDKKGFSRANISDGASLIEKLYNDPQLRKKLGENARKVWKENFTFDKVANMYEDVYKKLIGKS